MSSDGQRIAVGAPFNGKRVDSLNESIEAGAGYVRIFHLEDGSWVKIGHDIHGEAYGDESGSSVSISPNGMTVAIGSMWNNDGGPHAGHVRVYSLNSPIS